MRQKKKASWLRPKKSKWGIGSGNQRITSTWNQQLKTRKSQGFRFHPAFFLWAAYFASATYFVLIVSQFPKRPKKGKFAILKDDPVCVRDFLLRLPVTNARNLMRNIGVRRRERHSPLGITRAIYFQAKDGRRCVSRPSSADAGPTGVPGVELGAANTGISVGREGSPGKGYGCAGFAPQGGTKRNRITSANRYALRDFRELMLRSRSSVERSGVSYELLNSKTH